MKQMSRLMTFAFIPALALSLCTACAKTPETVAPVTTEETEETQSAEQTQSSSIQFVPPYTEGNDSTTGIEGTPLLEYGKGNCDQLVADMEAGRIPVEVSLLYDEEGGRPVVTVSDPETIKLVYELVSAIKVIEKSNTSITDSYHHFYFTLQDGSKAGFSFEGTGNICMGKDNYFVVGDEALWAFVRQLQEEAVDSNRAPQWHKIVVDAGDDLIIEFPDGAYDGESVTIHTVGVADEILSVYANGRQLKADDSTEMTYTFVMPDYEVHLTADVHPMVGSGGA